MKRSFYYAEIDMTVDVVDGQDDLLSTFSTYDVQALSLLLHSAITDFLLVRTLLTVDAAEYVKRLDEMSKIDKDKDKGG